MPEFWLVAVALASPVAGVVGFAIQLRNLKKIRLENEKLSLEIQRLRKEQEESNRRVKVATPEETERYSDIRFSRVPRTGAGAGEFDEGGRSPGNPVVSAMVNFALWFFIVLFLLYVAYDVFRVGRWLWTLI
jgi:hypothetical protein